MVKLGIGILFVLFSIAFLYIGIKYINRDNEKGLRIIQAVFTVLAILVDVFGLIIPGANDSFNIVINDNDYVTNNYFGGYLNNPSESLESFSSPEIGSDIEVVDSYTVGWGDNCQGRDSYTLDEINRGAIDGEIVFNSISNSVIGHEFNFVGARENTGIDMGKDNKWNGNVIEAEEGTTYFVRLYAHNNSRWKEDIAENVTVRFQIGEMVKVTGNDITLNGFNSGDGYYATAVYGFINATNAVPSEYWDGVKFVSNRPFHLEYIPGTALYVNNDIGLPPGYHLSDDVVTSGVPIGYEAMDGQIPGCYQFASYSTILVFPVFDD